MKSGSAPRDDDEADDDLELPAEVARPLGKGPPAGELDDFDEDDFDDEFDDDFEEEWDEELPGDADQFPPDDEKEDDGNGDFEPEFEDED